MTLRVRTEIVDPALDDLLYRWFVHARDNWRMPSRSSNLESSRCVRIDVAQEACYVRFVHGQSDHTAELPYLTARGEMMIAEFDADGRIMAIELVGRGKPCQE